jgi:hypothetical protein
MFATPATGIGGGTRHRELAITADKRVRRRMNCAALDVAELGIVYESLLAEDPVIQDGRYGLPAFSAVDADDACPEHLPT